MPDLTQLHRHARAIFDHALSSVDPRKAVRRTVISDGPTVAIGEACLSDVRIYAVAIGKAAVSMATGLDEALGARLTAGAVTGVLNSKRWQSFPGGHPLPNEASLAAAKAAFALVDRANSERAVVVFLISGGGSAMIEWPVSEEISLLDLRRANEALVGCGARINEINSVRRAFSAVKGGGLARRAPHARLFTLIVSDTNEGDEASVASGPTLAPPSASPSALEVVEHYKLDSVMPVSIMRAVRQARARAEAIEGYCEVLLDNSTALQAAAERGSELGYSCVIREEIREQAVEDGCHLLLANTFSEAEDGWPRRATPTKNASEGSLLCEISGGEFSCPVRGDGRGGRNLETVLRCAMELDQIRDGHCVVLSAGTDGIDGNCAAAGAIADETTIERARRLRVDPQDFLLRSDSYGFFERLNDLIVTGPTGTNVRDLRIVLQQQQQFAGAG